MDTCHPSKLHSSSRAREEGRGRRKGCGRCSSIQDPQFLYRLKEGREEGEGDGKHAIRWVIHPEFADIHPSRVHCVFPVLERPWRELGRQ